jgi:hypothetical protein
VVGSRRQLCACNVLLSRPQVAKCLAGASPPVLPYDTRDAAGRERFLPFTPQNHLSYRIPKNPDW